MKKMKLILTCLVIIMLSITGCSKNETNEKSADNNKKEEVKTEQKNTDSNALYNDSSSYKITSEVTMNSAKSTIIMYKKDKSYRMETSTSNIPSTSIVVYNDNDKMTYTYTKGDKTGMAMKQADMEENDGIDLQNMELSSISDIKNAFGEDVTIKDDVLDGKDVVYVESEDNEVLIKMWFSKEYFLPLKTQYVVNGNIVSDSKVVDLQMNAKLDDNLFKKPQGVEFKEFNFDGMMEN
ncbi:hypothetical protein WG909_12145 [Peptostreptococcaceae bacterium AGR-M142]